MKLPGLVASLDTVPEAYRDAYEKTSDGYVLQVDTTDYNAKINEFRGNNIRLTQEIDSIKKTLDKYKDVDPEKYQTALKTLQALEEKKLLEAGDVEKVIEQRTQTMRADYDGRITALTTRAESGEAQSKLYKGQLDAIAIENAVGRAITNTAIPKKGALGDIVLRAKQLWRVQEDGSMVAYKGDQVVYGKGGKDPMTMDEWAAGLVQEAPYFFEPNQGGGSRGSGSPQQKGGTVVSKADFGANIADIAAGKVTVDMNS